MNLISTKKALEGIINGDLVILPTDTVYGIAADAFNLDAVKKVYEIKGRAQEKPLIVLVSSIEMLKDFVVEIGVKEKLLIDKFWPGALTLLFEKNNKISDIVTAGGRKIGVRMPAQPQILEIIEASGRPIVATSVNKSGFPALSNIKEIDAQFPQLTIVDGGGTVLGTESTVLDLTEGKPKILREGAISKIQLEEVLKEQID